MQICQVDEATVSSIETDSSIDGQLLELTIGTLRTTMQEAFSPLDSINYELNSIDKNTRDNLRYLQKSLEDTNIGAINSDYNTVFSTIDMNLPLTVTNIKNAIAGLVKKIVNWIVEENSVVLILYRVVIQLSGFTWPCKWSRTLSTPTGRTSPAKSRYTMIMCPTLWPRWRK